jgi:hypothetical protein
MGFFDKLFGRNEEPRDEGTSRQYGQGQYGGQGGYGGQYGEPTRYIGQGPGQQPMTDQQAVERYRYLLRTAPPDAIEQAHAEAFSRLTPDQRRMVLEQLSAQVPLAERTDSEDPRSLARMATRAEMRQPGTLERTFGSIGPGAAAGVGGVGLGGLMAGTFFSSMAGMFVGSMIANSFFGYGAPAGFDQGYSEGSSEGQTADAGQDAGGQDAGGDYGGGGYEQTGGDFGGGDFGGGDFGGGFGDF